MSCRFIDFKLDVNNFFAYNAMLREQLLLLLFALLKRLILF